MATVQQETNDNPEGWKQSYIENPKFAESVQILIEITGLTDTEARDYLLGILVKVMFIERNLAENGKQTAETLFGNLKNTLEVSPLFKSAEELAHFCNALSPVFVFRQIDGTYRNSGNVYRKFCQFLRVRLKNGGAVNDDNFLELIEQFKESEEPTASRPTVNPFVDKEVLIDLESLRSLSLQMPRGFVYHKTPTKHVTLAETHNEPLALQLPILADTLVSAKIPVDKSRHVRLKAQVFLQRLHDQLAYVVDSKRFNGAVLNVPLSLFPADARDKILEKSLFHADCWVNRGARSLKFTAFKVVPMADETLWKQSEKTTCEMWDEALGSIIDNEISMTEPSEEVATPPLPRFSPL